MPVFGQLQLIKPAVIKTEKGELLVLKNFRATQTVNEIF